jgi:pleiotropic regulator 1
MATIGDLPPLNALLNANAKRTYSAFASYPDAGMKEDEKRCARCPTYVNVVLNSGFSARMRLAVKIEDEYKHYKQLPTALLAQQAPVGPARPKEQRKAITAGRALYP